MLFVAGTGESWPPIAFSGIAILLLLVTILQLTSHPLYVLSKNSFSGMKD
jgi:hypothetical protein